MENMNNMGNANNAQAGKNNGGGKGAMWIILVVLAIIAIGVWMFTKPKTESPAVTPPADETVLDGINDTDATATDEPGAATLSYQQALITYKDKRIQLGAGNICTATPNNVTYKNGTTIMIDNRAPVVRNVKIGTTYTIKAYGFKLVKLSSSTLPIKYLVDCNNQQNVATILLQK